ncbi:type II toxin-antitoxin system RelE/ParE family toxin [Prauserella oleivorans]|uniref:Type II toxin-antitoxin system RelE/ParE family toxin n=1 Tax=Prauserella oleivorans TaxID=1478153 RepID=A0ABW5WLJ0_9PSEU
MPYEIETSRSADKFLDKLAKGQPRDAEAIEDAIERLAEDPRPHGCITLSGADVRDVWRIRVGNYRICYQIDDGALYILVVTVSTRDDVYDVVRRVLGR